MKLIEYMPPFLREIREFKELFNSEDIEIEKLKKEIERIFNEVAVSSAETYGLERYEKIYSITDIAETVEGRRFNILLKMNDKVPYSHKWLCNLLDNLLGKENYQLEVDYKNYTVKLGVLALFNEIADMLNKELRKKIPANMELDVSLFQTEETKIYVAGIVHIGKTIKLKQEVF